MLLRFCPTSQTRKIYIPNPFLTLCSNCASTISPRTSMDQLTETSWKHHNGDGNAALASYKGASSNRKKQRCTAVACLSCKRMKKRCDDNRPCNRCVQLGIADECCDADHQKPGRKRKVEEEVSVAEIQHDFLEEWPEALVPSDFLSLESSPELTDLNFSSMYFMDADALESIPATSFHSNGTHSDNHGATELQHKMLVQHVELDLPSKEHWAATFTKTLENLKEANRPQQLQCFLWYVCWWMLMLNSQEQSVELRKESVARFGPSSSRTISC